MAEEATRRKRHWRDYSTAAGCRPVKEFLNALSDRDAAEIVAAMKDVQRHGLSVARHLRGDIYEVRADGDRQAFRILFAPEGRRQTILLALDGFSKKTQKTPPAKLSLAERRLRDSRARPRKLTRPAISLLRCSERDNLPAWLTTRTSSTR